MPSDRLQTFLTPLVGGLILLSIMLLIGIVVVGHLVDQARIEESAAAPAIRGWLMRIPALVAWFLLMLVLIRGFLQVLAFTDPGVPVDTALMAAVLTTGSWGKGWMVQAAAAFAALGLSWLLGGKRGQRIAIAVAASLIVLAQGGMGHGADQVWHPVVVGRLLTATHLFGAGIWIGSLIILALTVVPSLLRHGQHDALATIIARFSIWARSGVVLLVVSGGVMTWNYTARLVDAPDVLWGKLLVLKLLVLLPVLGLGWYNWRVVTPGLLGGDPPSRGRLRRAMLIEVLLALVIVGVTAMLVRQALPIDGG